MKRERVREREREKVRGREFEIKTVLLLELNKKYTIMGKAGYSKIIVYCYTIQRFMENYDLAL